MIFLLQTGQALQDFCPFPIAALSLAKNQNLLVYDSLVQDQKSTGVLPVLPSLTISKWGKQ